MSEIMTTELSHNISSIIVMWYIIYKYKVQVTLRWFKWAISNNHTRCDDICLSSIWSDIILYMYDDIYNIWPNGHFYGRSFVNTHTIISHCEFRWYQQQPKTLSTPVSVLQMSEKLIIIILILHRLISYTVMMMFVLHHPWRSVTLMWIALTTLPY
jgi:hypothetical protein